MNNKQAQLEVINQLLELVDTHDIKAVLLDMKKTLEG